MAFIEATTLSAANTESKIFLNSDKIIMMEGGLRSGCNIYLQNGEKFSLKESPSIIVGKIREAEILASTKYLRRA